MLPLISALSIGIPGNNAQHDRWAAVTAAGLHDGLPVTDAMVAAHPCLAKMPTVFTIPAASTFADDLAVYAWAIKTLLPSRLYVLSPNHSWHVQQETF